jgi:hypothetical protein
MNAYGRVRVKKDWEARLLAQALHKSGKLARTKEISLSFGGANKYRNPDFTCGCENRFQQHEVCDIEVAKSRSFFFKPCQNIS